MAPAPISQEIRDLFEEAGEKGSREWFDGGFRFGRLPRPRCFGLFVPMDRLIHAGRLILAGQSKWAAGKAARIGGHNVVPLLVERAGLPYTYKRPAHKSYEANMLHCDKRARRLMRTVFEHDFGQWVEAFDAEERLQDGEFYPASCRWAAALKAA